MLMRRLKMGGWSPLGPNGQHVQHVQGKCFEIIFIVVQAFFFINPCFTDFFTTS